MNRASARTAAYAALLVVGAVGGAIVAELLGPLFSSQRPPSAAGESARSKRRIVYYKDPMGNPDTSPVPKKDSMGMDYIPVYEGDEDDAGTIKVSADRIQKLGVRSEPAQLRTITRSIRATGTVQADEARQTVVTARFDGWIEKLMVARTGDKVRRGQALAEIYSFELQRVQIEHFKAAPLRGGLDQDLGPLYRLRNLGIAEEDVQRIVKQGRAARTLPLRAPMDGVVVEKKAVEGMRAAAGEMLFRIVDLSTVWMIAEVFEQDLAEIALGQEAEVTLLAYPGRRFFGKVTFIYPMVTAATRTARVRIELPNPGAALMPDMYATVAIATGMGAAPVLAVPDSAVIDSGMRRIVLVDKGEGRFEPREIKTGRRGDGYVAVLEGLHDGDKVVVAANFLIDAESNLTSALRALTKDGAKPKAGEEKKP